jgi:hypothetical protein
MDFRFEKATAIGREHCPFCPGRENATPPEVLAYRRARPTDLAGTCASFPTSFPRCASRARSNARARGCSIA